MNNEWVKELSTDDFYAGIIVSKNSFTGKIMKKEGVFTYDNNGCLNVLPVPINSIIKVNLKQVSGEQRIKYEEE